MRIFLDSIRHDVYAHLAQVAPWHVVAVAVPCSEPFVKVSTERSGIFARVGERHEMHYPCNLALLCAAFMVPNEDPPQLESVALVSPG